MPIYNPPFSQGSQRPDRNQASPDPARYYKFEGRVMIDPSIIRAARQIFRQYVDCYANQLPRPLGIAINRKNMSGKLIHTHLVLLPQETFVPLEIIEAAEH